MLKSLNIDTNILNQALLYLQFILNRLDKCLNDFPNMPILTGVTDYDQV
ncbi:8855_t:CDS:2 [Cetraspora pellucida]|uniref:8855_t:CDS:1 n=1 Tax=Cetraspora pellucida TaxID=1433469 RepID=A0ACA9KBG2_9GLOM|nr:8855_t:CDS:2 [Cetraspora pellucida]